MPALQPDLFNESDLPGLTLAEAIVTPSEEAALIAAIDGVELTPFRFHQWRGKRLTASFGWSYDFDTGRIAPAAPIPEWLLPLRERAADFARVCREDLVQALLIRYDPGAGIGWHRDRDVFEQVVGFSLAAPATLRFRRRKPGGFDRANLDVAPGSAYLLSGEARWQWEHSIAAGDQLRFSMTFRALSDKGRRIAAAAS
jgi:alkylated DNA repair dioxygenase AlkB